MSKRSSVFGWICLFSSLLLLLSACSNTAETQQKEIKSTVQVGMTALELQTTMKGVWELESRALANGKVLRPPDIHGLIIANETHSVAFVPLLDNPKASLIFAARNQFSKAAQKANLFYLTCSANAKGVTSVRREFPAEDASFARQLNSIEAARLTEMAGEKSVALLQEVKGLLVQRLPDTPTHVYAGESLTVIDEQFVDTYVRRREDQGDLTRHQKAMMGTWELKSRTLSDGKVLSPPDLTGLIVATANHSVALVPFVDAPEANLIFAARNEFTPDGHTANLFYLSCSANSRIANRQVMTEFPPEKGIFEDAEGPLLSKISSAAGIEKLPQGAFVQRLPETPLHVYADNQLYVVGDGHLDVYQRTGGF